ncbi:MAG TPA: DUF1326 domain-containing protein [Acidimicrobiales bacterium]|nr:DUF1326 domain-containing protein [Acidimicrobiales bacterium]
MTTTETKTEWRLKGKGYEFCNCQPGCTCNFSGFPTSADGSCKAAVATRVSEGNCGEIDLSGIDAVAILDWPSAIHDGGGKAIFVVPPEVSEEQLGAMAQIFTGELGGMPWEILGTTFEVAGVVRAPVNITDDGINSGFSIPGVGEAKGATLKNPVTDEPHGVSIVLDQGFIWKKGDCGQGSFNVEAEGISMSFENSNWIYYEFDWTNQG